MVDMNAQDINLSSLIAPGMRSPAAEDALSQVDVLHGGWRAADEALTQYSTLDPAQRLAIKVPCVLLCLPSISFHCCSNTVPHALALGFLIRLSLNTTSAHT